jgi:N-acetyl sugar amidotransferase
MSERPDLLPDPQFRTSPDTYRQCALGLLDTNDDPEIRFDTNGISHYYYDYRAEEGLRVGTTAEQQARLAEVLHQIRAAKKGREYDTIVGLSGGVDSTYIAHLAKEYGLNPLCVHFDNGWNSELAVKTIENIVSRLGFDLFTYVIDWDEFKDLQLAYLRASVIDIEVVTDHAIFATLYRLARQHGIRHILSGTNVVTESVLPRHWNYNKADHVNIRAIHREFGTRPLKTFPFMDLRVKKLYQMVHGVHSVSVLDLVPYHKAEVKQLIMDQLGWRDYGGKHYESIWTRFYQGHILPTKFGVDKRRAHLTNLIYSGQLSREAALAELALPMYPAGQLEQDRELVLKKLGLTPKEWDEIMQLPVRRHTDFETERSAYTMYPWLKPLRPLVNLAKYFLRRRPAGG